MSTFTDWKSAVKEINKSIGPRTEKQMALAEYCGISVSQREPIVIVAARLRHALASELHTHDALEPSDSLLNYIDLLCKEVGFPKTPEVKEQGVGEAWIVYLRLKQRKEALTRLKLYRGDIVSGSFGYAEVASISQIGRVFFRGGRGFSAWPDSLTVVERHDETTISPLRKQVRNEASDRKRTARWSSIKSQDLEEYLVPDSSNTELTEALAHFESKLAEANDEQPIQQLFETYPVILGSLLGRSPRYLIPRPNLAGKYIPDFLLVDIDSQGAHWTFIELESPSAKIYIKGGKMFSDRARTGIEQIREWRRWVADNRDLARKPKREGGFGYADIDDHAQGLVILGRDHHLVEKGDPIRRQLKNENNISLRTYDGILKQIYSCVSFAGPPAINPFLLREMD